MSTSLVAGTKLASSTVVSRSSPPPAPPVPATRYGSVVATLVIVQVNVSVTVGLMVSVTLISTLYGLEAAAAWLTTPEIIPIGLR